ncbi:MAG: L-seryl-tRNA(Sec) selenium transferase [Syntrophus sp. (in: bacteria)]|nr:L-seryl-tRNA(Sec) selenium transferase [Syntrophus sp. (in: bacteria)]
MSNELLRKIPKVDEILVHDDWQELIKSYSEGIAKDALRQYLDELRVDIKTGKVLSIPVIDVIVDETRKKIVILTTPTLRRVINGTGTIIHTNLGRSLLAKTAIDAIITVASHYSNLEYDLEKGDRGDRHDHCIAVLRKLTGAEDALVVNNNAGAVFLVLNTFAEGKEVIISRGELVEIGGSFRIPDVMKKSGAILKEVGTTNRTYIADYERAITDNTGLIMKVHTSNYRIRGFTHETNVEALTALGKRSNVPTFYDAGSGLLYSVKAEGILDEPHIFQEIAKGLDMVSFSGDKLLGAPQAGIIAGEKDFIDALKKNPMTRALRPDKFTLAGLESTLLLYLDMEHAKKEIPTLRMIHEDVSVLKTRAQRLARQLKKKCNNVTVSVVEVYSEVGGGSFPDVVIPSYGLSFIPHNMSVEALEARLRNLAVPIVGRIEKERLLFDMRTILQEDEPLVLSGLETALSNGQ